MLRVPLSRGRPRAIIFDHDGTLVDSLALVVAASNAVLRAHGHAELAPDVIIAGMVLPTAPRMGSHAGVADPLGQRQLADEFYDQAHHLGGSLVRAYPGVATLLERAASSGVAMGVVSNNQGVLVRDLMRSLDLARHCRVIWGEEDVPAPKPDPRGILAAQRALGVALDDCIYVGDGVTDVHGAHRAGMQVIGVTWGIHARSEMETMGFDRLVDDVQELERALRLGS